MLGNSSDGLVDGPNPVKTVVLWNRIRGFLALIVGIAALALSWVVSPECVTVPPNCKDGESYCSDPGIFQPADSGGCDILAEYCMETCGCCAENPTGWCPNKLITFQTIIADNQFSLILFTAVFAALQLFTCMGLCCSPPSAIKKKMLLYLTVCVVFVLLILGGFWLIYMLTECRQKFRGISDVLLMLSPVSLLYSFGSILIASTEKPLIALYDAEQANMAAHLSRRDPNILVLDVGPDRTRKFLEEEQRRGSEVTVQVSRSGWLQCCRVWYFLYIAAVLAFVLYAGSLKVFIETRSVCFYAGFALVFGLQYIYSRILLTKPYLDHQNRQVTRKWLQGLQGPQQLLLFHSAPKSVISFGNGQVAGRSTFAFVPPSLTVITPSLPLRKTTHTRIIHGHEGVETDTVLEFKVVVRRESAGALQSDIRAESVARIPLESHHVGQVREWLQERRQIFEFETGPEVELLEPSP